jgi:hypothetical protein
MHLHHIIPRSRGGTDDYTEFKSEYDHAYDHALDFVLFDHAPVFDCRHEAWPLLPDNLREAVRSKLRVLWNSHQSSRGKRGGATCKQLHLGVCAEGFSKKVSENMTQFVKNGEHWWQQDTHRKRVSSWNSERFSDGSHPLQQPCKCPICGKDLKTKGGLGPHMRKHSYGK